METKVEKLQNTVGSFQFGAFPHIWPHILGTYFDRGMGHVLPHISRTRFFLDMRFLQNDGESSHPSICTIWTKSLELFLRKMTKNDKNPILTPFLPQNSRTRIFFENRAPSLFCIYGPLTSCKKSEKSLEPISVTLCHGRTDLPIYRFFDFLRRIPIY